MGQTNTVISADQTSAAVPNQAAAGQKVPRSVEAIRKDCIQQRRIVCGKILQVLPEGLVVESGYTNLTQRSLGRSWLVPGTVQASLATSLVEGKEPESICAGLVFLTDYPKSRRAKPKPFDYVILVGYPTGHYTYTSVGSLQRTVRRFSGSLPEAVNQISQAASNEPPAAATAGK